MKPKSRWVTRAALAACAIAAMLIWAGSASALTSLAQPVLRLTLKRQFADYCTTLKQVLENTPPAT